MPYVPLYLYTWYTFVHPCTYRSTCKFGNSMSIPIPSTQYHSSAHPIHQAIQSPSTTRVVISYCSTTDVTPLNSRCHISKLLMWHHPRSGGVMAKFWQNALIWLFFKKQSMVTQLIHDPQYGLPCMHNMDSYVCTIRTIIVRWTIEKVFVLVNNT